MVCGSAWCGRFTVNEEKQTESFSVQTAVTMAERSIARGCGPRWDNTLSWIQIPLVTPFKKRSREVVGSNPTCVRSKDGTVAQWSEHSTCLTGWKIWVRIPVVPFGVTSSNG